MRHLRTPIPCATIARTDDAERVRRLHCRSYDACLGLAARLAWPGFTCVHCGAFLPCTPEEEAYDLDRLLALASDLGGVSEEAA